MSIDSPGRFMQQHRWQPEIVIFIGLQASGKSTLYRERFFTTHVRINLDMLKTRHRERTLLQACIEMQQHCVVDNTNVLQAERAVYIGAARRARFRVTGYFFEPDVQACLARNAERTGREQIPVQGIWRTARRLQRPKLNEGFDSLYHVRIDATGTFIVTLYDKLDPPRH